MNFKTVSLCDLYTGLQKLLETFWKYKFNEEYLLFSDDTQEVALHVLPHHFPFFADIREEAQSSTMDDVAAELISKCANGKSTLWYEDPGTFVPRYFWMLLLLLGVVVHFFCLYTLLARSAQLAQRQEGSQRKLDNLTEEVHEVQALQEELLRNPRLPQLHDRSRSQSAHGDASQGD